MLKKLKLKNVALIEIIEINFQKGLNVFTGESGSGKSLILDSLNSLFGGTNIPLNHLIRPGKSECLIQAIFDISPITSKWLIDNGYNYQDDLKIHRLTSKNGQKFNTKYFINDLHISKKKIISLGLILLDFAGQSDTFLFNSQDYMKSIIDELGSDQLKSLALVIKNKSKVLSKLRKEIDLQLEKKQKQEENLFASAKLLQILEEANLNNKNEINELKSKQLVLANDFELNNSINTVLGYLNSNEDNYSSISFLLIESIKCLSKVCKYDKTLVDFSDQLVSIQSQVENIIYSLVEYSHNLESNCDETTLNFLQERLFKLQNLEKTFSLRLPDLIDKRDELSELSNSSISESYINKLKKNFEDESNLLKNLYLKQSEMRKDISLKLQTSVLMSLQNLGLQNAIFKIVFDKNTDSIGEDKIYFLFSANPDQSLSPISKVISGGEMSRFLLALKSSISNIPNTLFFDEIDNGLSGKSLLAMLKLVKKLSLRNQILCITHHPLLAASANTHFKVQKKLTNGLTFTSLTQLSTKKQKQNELAELIGGGFDEANDYASTLLDKAAA